jgi:hypothetical protein
LVFCVFALGVFLFAQTKTGKRILNEK